MELKHILTTCLTSLICISASNAFSANTNKNEAKTAYLKAQKLFKAEEYKMALPLFEKAYELSNKKPTSIMGLAQCERMLKLYEKSIIHFEEYLATKPSKKRQKRINETLKILKEQQQQAQAEKAEADRKDLFAKEQAEQLRQKEAELFAEKLADKLVQKQVPKAVETQSESSNTWLWWTLGAIALSGAAVGVGVAMSPGADLYAGTSGTLLEPK